MYWTPMSQIRRKPRVLNEIRVKGLVSNRVKVNRKSRVKLRVKEPIEI